MAIPLNVVDGEPRELEARVLERWSVTSLAAEVDARNWGRPRWTFYEGPPTANGRPGVHHLWARSFKDLYIRYRSLSGWSVSRKGGWDCHGLPVELEVEKELGLSSKVDIERYGIADFNAACRASVQRYVADWIAQSERAGFWIDMADAYWTMSNDFIESTWWLIGELWRQGLLYEDQRVLPYCARCGTALSSHELGQPDVYRNVVDPSLLVRMPIDDGPEVVAGADLLIWTTTPWTLPSNVAVAVGADVDYVRVPASVLSAAGADLIIARDRLPEATDREPVASLPGSALVGATYRPPYLATGVGHGTAHRVVAAEFVDTMEGSGLVHIAPAFGEDDAELGRHHGLPAPNPVDGAGRFDDSIAGIDIAGLWVKDADPVIIDDLTSRGLVVERRAHDHSYPHCWRCQTPLIYWSKRSWFVKTTERRNQLLAANATIGWHPESVKTGRFGKWLEGNVDWALSRDRYWGTPLPVWRCADCGTDRCVSSIAELTDLAGRDLGGIDLHRPAIDEVVVACADCGAPAERVKAVIDAWFDSGSMPSAQFHYPFEHSERFAESFPADFICEGLDQTRGWFYSLLAVNSLVFGRSPYRNAVCLSLIVDRDGKKMSKSRGNAIDPDEILGGPGADALRWFFFSQGQPWTSRRVSVDAVEIAARETLLTLKSSYAFLATYVNASAWTPDRVGAGPTEMLDRWLLDRVDRTVAIVTEAMEDFDSFTAATALSTLVDHLSNWYIRLSRRRFWAGDDSTAFTVLHEALTTTAQLLAPFCPFLSDELYRGLTGEASVHLAPWPTSQGRTSDRLAVEMDGVRRLVALGRTARSDAKIKTRQPLKTAIVVHPGTDLSDAALDLLGQELNVKRVERLVDVGDITSWVVVPNYRTLGPRLGSRLQEVASALAAADGNALRVELLARGTIEVAEVELTADDVELRPTETEGYSLAADGDWAVALEVEIDEALRAEGMARELARLINDLRKRLGYDVADRVEITLDIGDDLRTVISDHLPWVAAETLATDIRIGTAHEPLRLDGRSIRASLALAGSAAPS